jgi:hypothetical protein
MDKIGAFLLSLLLLMLPALAFPAQDQTSSQYDAPMDLNQRYRLDNDQWFEGKLVPASVTVISSEEFMGRTTMTADYAQIYIDAGSNIAWSTVRLTLFHEECHVEEWPLPNEDPHGKRWQQCMQRLAKEGAFAKIW